MRANTAKLPRSALHWHYPHYHHDRPASSIRERDWKLIEYLDGSSDDRSRRLIMLIDEFYDRRVKLLLSAAARPQAHGGPHHRPPALVDDPAGHDADRDRL